MAKSGQKKARRKAPFWERVRRKIAPSRYLENKLIQLEKLDDEARQLWTDFQNYLAEEREKVLDQITSALLSNTKTGYTDNNFSRIAGAKFSKNPLSSKGSYLVPPGGRFNFGQSISYHSYFSALYIASDYDTAFCEKYHEKEDFKSVDGLTVHDMALREPESFMHARVKFSLDKVIDLREDSAIDSFYEEISHIEMPKHYEKHAKKLKISMFVAQSSSNLKESIFSSNYEQWDYWIDQPSPSQWFGHYARMAGIQGVIYPSVRNTSGYNIAVYLDQFEDSDCTIELADECDSVPDKFKVIDKNNFNLFI